MRKLGKSHLRSIFKAITWRITASIDTLILVWLLTGSFSTGATIGVLEIATKIFIYYVHERLWTKSTKKKTKSKRGK